MVPASRPEQPVTVRGPVSLEARVAPAAGPSPAAPWFVVAHPHPLHGGSLDNKVVEVLTRGLGSLGANTPRFNFRGVGGSAGRFDGGHGEQDDLLAALAYARTQPGDGRVMALGYSFGAWMATAALARAAPPQRCPLVLVAPPLELDPHAELMRYAPPVHLVAGDQDLYCPAAALQTLAAAAPAATLHLLPGVDHFFHGALDRLWAVLEPGLGAWVRGDRELAARPPEDY